MSKKEVKEESLLPSVEDFVNSKIESWEFADGVSKESVISIVKEAMELTRDKTLELAVKEGLIKDPEIKRVDVLRLHERLLIK